MSALDFTNIYGNFIDLRDERTEWEQEWRQISDYLLPGRGIYQTYSRPQKRKLTTRKVINPIAEDSLYVLTSGMHGGLTSPAMSWYEMEWVDPAVRQVPQLALWLQESKRRLDAGLQASNFYSVINSFYIEYAGFGTGSVYVGSVSYISEAPFRFEILTAGEYYFDTGTNGLPNTFFRTIYLTPVELVERFGRKCSSVIRDRVAKGLPGIHEHYIIVLEVVMKRPFMGMPYTQVFYELGEANKSLPHIDMITDRNPLGIGGFREFPYPTARWSTIGSDVYGIGPGSRALRDIMRLQEMERAFLMATHKSINPPLNAPARMKGKLSTLPGGFNYYSNPNEVVSELYKVQFDYQGVSAAIERVEQRIRRNFFNDIFLTAARDPNKSPLKATEVNAREAEKMLRLGPVIERLQYEFLQPVIERCFNIMLRKQLLPELSPDLQEIAGDYSITVVSPLAAAQRAVALNGINAFLAFVGNAAQFDQTILDKLDTDATVDVYGDITGVDRRILRSDDEVRAIRKQRQIQAQRDKQAAEQAMAAKMGGELDAQRAQAAKAQAEAGATLAETQMMGGA